MPRHQEQTPTLTSPAVATSTIDAKTLTLALEISKGRAASWKLNKADSSDAFPADLVELSDGPYLSSNRSHSSGWLIWGPEQQLTHVGRLIRSHEGLEHSLRTIANKASHQLA